MMSFAQLDRRGISHLLILAAATLIAVGLGQDFNWDQIAYHLYAGYNVMENRPAADYLAGSLQSYFNPYSHVPFYLMVRNGLPPLLIVALLALFHAVNLVLVYEMAKALNRRPDGQCAWAPVWLAVLLALCAPVFLVELGNTFNEISTSVFVLAGWCLLVRNVAQPRLWPAVLAGVLIGMAVALKLSNLFFTVTALPLLLCAQAAWHWRLKAVLWFAAAGGLGVLLAGGWWGWQLWETMGNPLFPFFNSIFHSPHMTDAPLTHYRFMPASLSAFAMQPLMIAAAKAGVHFELVAPDFRYAVLLLLACLFALKALLRMPQVAKWPASDAFPAAPRRRALVALSCAFLLAWLIWASSSGNSRYFLPMSCVAAVLLSTLVFQFTGHWRFRVYLIAPLIVAHLGSMWYAANFRWAGVDSGKAWFEVDVPAELKRQPSLYLHLDSQPATFLLPYLAQGSNMVNPTGQFVVRDKARFGALLDRHAGQVRALRRFQTSYLPIADDFDIALKRFDLQPDMSDCLKIRWRTEMGAVHYHACKLVPRQWKPLERAQFHARLQRADSMFDRLERWCPKLLQPRGLVTESVGSTMRRHYSNTDSILDVRPRGDLVLFNPFTNAPTVTLGNIDALEQALPALPPACR